MTPYQKQVGSTHLEQLEPEYRKMVSPHLGCKFSRDLLLYGLGDVSLEKDALEGHLAACEACQQRMAAYDGLN